MSARSWVWLVGLVFGAGALASCYDAQPPAGTASETVAIEDVPVWLEEQSGEQALEWAATKSEIAAARFAEDLAFEALVGAAEDALGASSALPSPRIVGPWAFRVERSNMQTSGVLNVAPAVGFGAGQLEWRPLLDLQMMSDGDRSVVLRSIECAAPRYGRCLLTLSSGGSDAAQAREFDLAEARFVSDGFAGPIDRGTAIWIDEDQILSAYPSSQAGRTPSGYSGEVRLWNRGEDYADARVVLEAGPDDLGLEVRRVGGPDGAAFIMQRHNFWDQTWWRVSDGEAAPLPLPRDAQLLALSGEVIVFALELDYAPHGELVLQGGVIYALPVDAFEDEGWAQTVEAVFEPGPLQVLQDATEAAEGLLIAVLEDISGAVYHVRRRADGWEASRVDLPNGMTIQLAAANAASPVATLVAEGFLQPRTLLSIDLRSGRVDEVARAQPIYDASGMVAERFEAISADGAAIPYTVLRRADVALDGRNPTYLYGYGGFQYSVLPFYAGVTGKLWLERGGIYVHTHLRGGGEFGPDWHAAAQGLRRQNAYDDMIAVAEEVIARGYASPATLGVLGGSNGGLMAGNMYVQRPDLFGGVIAGGALLDMLAYTRLGAGASWIGEFGDPADPETAAFLETISPFHTVQVDGDYPPIFLTAAQNDDRVHPAHARRFAYRLDQLDHRNLYYEQAEGGHEGGGAIAGEARNQARIHSFFGTQLDPDGRLTPPR